VYAGCQGELASVDLKFQGLLGKLLLYSSVIDLDVYLPPIAEADQVSREINFFSSLITALRKEASRLETARVIVGGLQALPGTRHDDILQARVVEFFTPLAPGAFQWSASTLPAGHERHGSIYLTGTVVLAALIHEKESVESAIRVSWWTRRS